MTTPTYELCILFMHHRDDAVTRLHFDMLRRSNPEALIVPLVDMPQGALPGAIDVSDFGSTWSSADKWRSCDSMLYRWFLNRPCDAQRYLLLEYDCWCDVDMREYYREYWDADVVASRYELGQRRWIWFHEVRRLAPEDRAYAAGVWPLAGMMFSHAALEKICALVSRDAVFSELRLGTAIRRAGLRVQTLTGEKLARVHAKEYAPPIRQPGLYHAVKSSTHNRGRVVRNAQNRVRHVLRRILSVSTRRALLDGLARFKRPTG